MQWQFQVRAVYRDRMWPQWYAETHAGPGLIRFDRAGGHEFHPGSTIQAAITEPFFDKLLFIESDPAIAASLDRVYRRYKAWPQQACDIAVGDCNTIGVHAIRQMGTSGAGMVFVDPEGLDYKYELLKGISETSTVYELLMLFPYDMAIARTWQQNPQRILDMFSSESQATVQSALDARQRAQTTRAENAVDTVIEAAVHDLGVLGWTQVTETQTFRNDQRSGLYNLVHATRNEVSKKIFGAVAPVRSRATNLRGYT